MMLLVFCLNIYPPLVTLVVWYSLCSYFKKELVRKVFSLESYKFKHVQMPILAIFSVLNLFIFLIK